MIELAIISILLLSGNIGIVLIILSMIFNKMNKKKLAKILLIVGCISFCIYIFVIIVLVTVGPEVINYFLQGDIGISHSTGIIGGSDGPTAIFTSATNIISSTEIIGVIVMILGIVYHKKKN